MAEYVKWKPHLEKSIKDGTAEKGQCYSCLTELERLLSVVQKNQCCLEGRKKAFC